MPIARSVIGRNAGASQRFALSFPLNDDFPNGSTDHTAPFTALKYVDPHLDGLPFWGAGGTAGVTMICRRYVRQQTGYYAPPAWHSDAGDFLNSVFSGHGYWGAPTPFPYTTSPGPTPGNVNGTDHYWEIPTVNNSTGQGDDFMTLDGGGFATVVKPQWYTTGMRATWSNSNSKTIKAYFDLPDVDSSKTITQTITRSGWGDTDCANPQLTIGDSPWGTISAYQHESFGGYLASLKIFNAVLSEADMLSEAANMDSVVTTAGQAACWYFKPGWRNVDDLASEYGTARSLVWMDSDHKATLVARG